LLGNAHSQSAVTFVAAAGLAFFLFWLSREKQREIELLIKKYVVQKRRGSVAF